MKGKEIVTDIGRRRRDRERLPLASSLFQIPLIPGARLGQKLGGRIPPRAQGLNYGSHNLLPQACALSSKWNWDLTPSADTG